MSDFLSLSLSELSSLAKEGKNISSFFLDRIDQHADELGLIASDNREQLASFLNGFNNSESKLSGVPVGIKDNIALEGSSLSCASKILEGFISPYDATCIHHLKEAGALPLMKINMDEFAMGSSNENSALMPARNPWDKTRVPGGSSGASAAIVAAGLLPAALGSDTGGSIRQPAAYCGVSGYKPSYGMISRNGLVAFASSLDQIGPIARKVEDLALLTEIMARECSKDATYNPELSRDFKLSDIDLKGLKFAYVRENIENKGLEPEIRENFLTRVDELKAKGASVEEISFPTLKYALATYYITATAEASSNLARFDGIRYGHRSADASSLSETYVKSRSEGFGEEVKRRILLGTFVLSSGYYDAYYGKAQYTRKKIKEEFSSFFKNYDCIISPTTPGLPFKLGERSEDPLKMYLEDIFTVPANLAGIPALSIPSGLSKNNLPMGFHMMSEYGFDKKLLEIAKSCQDLFGVLGVPEEYR